MKPVPIKKLFGSRDLLRLESNKVDLQIREKLIFSVICVHVVLMTLFVADMQHRQRSFLLEAAEAGALKQAGLTADAAAFWVIADDAAGMNEVLQLSRQNTPVRYAFIMDMRGQVLAHTNREQLGTFINDTEILRVLHSPKQARVWNSDEKLIQVAAPIMVEDDTLGWVMLGMGTAPTFDHLRKIGLDGLLYTITAIILGAVAAWLLANIVLRQLGLILQGVDRMQNNDLGTPIPVVVDDEIGKVARALNRAMSSLSQSAEKLQKEMHERAEAQQRIRHLSRRLMDGSEEERKRIGHDLHDELGQSVTGFQFALHSLRDLLPHGTKDAGELCDKLIGYAEEMGDSIRRIAANSWPAALEHMGLVVAGRAFIRECAKRSPNIRFIFEDTLPEDDNPHRLDPRLELACYRIIQESVNNALRHAEAAHISVEIHEQEHHIILQITDDGCGFDIQKTPGQYSSEQGGIGLIGMHERAAALDGTLHVLSSPGNGCCIEACLPLLRS